MHVKIVASRCRKIEQVIETSTWDLVIESNSRNRYLRSTIDFRQLIKRPHLACTKHVKNITCIYYFLGV